MPATALEKEVLETIIHLLRGVMKPITSADPRARAGLEEKMDALRNAFARDPSILSTHPDFARAKYLVENKLVRPEGDMLVILPEPDGTYGEPSENVGKDKSDQTKRKP